MRLYVGNLSYSTTTDRLKEVFSAFGEVSDVFVVSDRNTGRSKGFGFVEIPDDGQAQEAMRQLDGTDLDGRGIRVNEATPQEK